MTIAYVTAASAIGEQETDWPLLEQASATRGLAIERVVWDDPSVDWARFEHVVLRTCWDYVARLPEFLAWADTVPNLRNSPATIRWNTDKTYLRALDAADVPIIETRWDVRSGDELPAGDEWVVKPTVSAGSRDTARWTDPADAYRHSESLLDAGRPTMTQPYVASVDDEGETAMLFFGGEFSHSVRKGALLVKGEGVNQERDGRGENAVRTPTARQQEVATQALEVARRLTGDDLLYARVDLVSGPDGDPLVIELELTEPFFFLDMVPEAASTFVRVLDGLGRPRD